MGSEHRTFWLWGKRFNHSTLLCIFEVLSPHVQGLCWKHDLHIHSSWKTHTKTHTHTLWVTETTAECYHKYFTIYYLLYWWQQIRPGFSKICSLCHWAETRLTRCCSLGSSWSAGFHMCRAGQNTLPDPFAKHVEDASVRPEKTEPSQEEQLLL